MTSCRSPHDDTDLKQMNRKRRALGLAIALSLLAFLGQLVGSFFTGSLSLLGDTAHVFTDVFSLTVSFTAITLAAMPATQVRSFGLYRLEVLATFLNGVLLVVVGGGLLWESIDRLRHPSPVLALPLLWIAALGMLVNIVSALLLARAMGGHSHHGHGHDHGHGHHSHEHAHEHQGHEHGTPAATPDRNLQGAYLHVVSDALGSLAVVVGAILTYYTDWLWVDPALAIVLSLLILRWSSRLLLDSGHVLLEGVPRHIQAEKVLEDLKALDERVAEVEDLHIWEITSRMYAATAEVRVGAMTLEEAESLRLRMDALLRQRFGIAHSVLALKP